MTACDIIVLAGQSNALGLGVGAVRDSYCPDERILCVSDNQDIDFIEDENNGYAYLKVKYPSEFFVSVAAERASAEGKRGDLALYFAARYVQSGMLPSNRKLLIVQSPVGGTGFAKHHWGVGDVLYKRMIDMTDYALSLHRDNRIVAFLWHQGEHDAIENAELSAKTRKAFYAEKFGALVRSVRQKYAAFDFPVLCGGFTDAWTKRHAQNCKAIRDALQAVCRADGNAGFVSAKGLRSNGELLANDDILHFSRAALRKLGIRYYKRYVAVLQKR